MNVRPSRSSWWILSVVWTIVLFSSISLAPGATYSAQWSAIAGSWISIAYIVGSLGVAVSTLWRGSDAKWQYSDYLCAIFASIAVILFFVFKDPQSSLIFGILADFFGLIPTIIHSHRSPQEESFISWCIGTFGSLLGIFAVSHWSLSFESASDWASPIYIFLINISITLLIGFRLFQTNRLSKNLM